MTAGVEILATAGGATLQDGGRRGYLRYGVHVAGPMDRAAFAMANAAAGAVPGAAAIEISIGGLELTPRGRAVRLAIAGGDFIVRHGERQLSAGCRLTVQPGERLSVKAGTAGMWCYLAFCDRLDLPQALGAHATHARTGIGGLAGRGLRAGDFLPLAPSPAEGPADGAFAIADPAAGAPIRVMLGPQDDFFAPDQIAAFFAAEWTVSPKCDRMAYFLNGPKLAHLKGFNIISDGIAMGAIQVPGNGLPIVLMADCQPTGGYPKIANVITADLGRFAQMRPGTRFRFQAVAWEAARAAKRRLLDAMAGIELRALARAPDLSSERLLGLNLVGGVWGPGHEARPL
ncbi:biotin-dependent carboxyltransferase family protein [Xanthobacter sp. VNH20]|uniref:5-oxoprolinase subunit C family protein n=1 Tax=Xanthobacter sp. VNH20 TaxID=3156616 RepID=UPI0032B54CC1